MTAIVALVVWISVFALVMTIPVPRKWKDDGDCTRIVQHTIRIPTALERFTLWQGRYYLFKEYPDG